MRGQLDQFAQPDVKWAVPFGHAEWADEAGHWLGQDLPVWALWFGWLSLAACCQSGTLKDAPWSGNARSGSAGYACVLLSGSGRRADPRIRDLTAGQRTLEERLQGARSNNRFLDKRIAGLEAQLLAAEPGT